MTKRRKQPTIGVVDGYLITLADAGTQNECLQKLKTNGIEVIQTSNGLGLKTALPKVDVENLIGLPVQSVTGDDGELGSDVQKFLGEKK